MRCVVLLVILATQVYCSTLTCSKNSLRVRKDWRKLTLAERANYISAVQCLLDTKSMLSRYAYPIAVNRYFDFAAVQVEQLRNTTTNGFHLAWNRYFLWLYETEIRERCGYQGGLPYWNIPASANSIRSDSIMDGSEYSLSGDGKYTDNNPIVLGPTLSIPHGSGGGCIMSGPFVNMNTTFVMPPNSYLINGSSLPYYIHEYNPECLQRDINNYVARTWFNFTAVQAAVEAEDMKAFTDRYFGVVGSNNLGLLSSSFFILGNGNARGSAQDPVWWSLMAMHDRTYSSWQLRHSAQANSLIGTATPLNLPPSDNVTLDTVMPGWGTFESNVYTVGDLLNTTAGPFCYEYDEMI